MSKAEKTTQKAFKHVNRFMLLMWRLGLGGWVNASPAIGGRIMVLTHTGRKSGLRRRTPVNYYLIENGDIYCTAGFGAESDWYRNLMANPSLEVWLPDGWWNGSAEDVSRSDERLALLRCVLKNSGFAAFAAGVNPYTFSDERLAEVTQSYRLVRIRRTAERTGRGGPGDLVMLWPWAASILFILWLGTIIFLAAAR